MNKARCNRQAQTIEFICSGNIGGTACSAVVARYNTHGLKLEGPELLPNLGFLRKTAGRPSYSFSCST